MPDISEDEFNERMERAFDPTARRSLIEPAHIDLGPTDDQRRDQLDAYMAQFDDLDALDYTAPAPIFTDEELDEVRAENPATPVTPAYTSRYDRQFLKRIELDKELANLNTSAPRYHVAMAELAEVRRRIKIELDRSTDDTYRERERADEYKLTIGKDERNADRRDRPDANVMTPKEVLAAETPEEKKKREHQRRLELQRIRRAKGKATK